MCGSTHAKCLLCMQFGIVTSLHDSSCAVTKDLACNAGDTKRLPVWDMYFSMVSDDVDSSRDYTAQQWCHPYVTQNCLKRVHAAAAASVSGHG